MHSDLMTPRTAPAHRPLWWEFLRAAVRAPGRVGAIVPSGPALAALMTRDASADTGPVLELGPGSGVLTRALLDRGVKPADLILVEYEPELAERLAQAFPQSRVLCADATALDGNAALAPASVGMVVSGLPLLNFDETQIEAILRGAFAALKDGAGFYQFTYGLRCPIAQPLLDKLGLRARRIGGTFRNLPPARVYRIERKD